MKRELNSYDTGQSPVAGFCEDGDEFLDSIKTMNSLVICDTIIFSRMTLIGKVSCNKTICIVMNRGVRE